MLGGPCNGLRPSTCGIMSVMKTNNFARFWLVALVAACTTVSSGAIRAVTPIAWNGDPNCWQMKRHAEKMAVVTIDGDDVYANVIDTTLKPWDPAARLEIHRQYFDIHVPVSGEEVDGYICDEANAKANAATFDVEKDYVLFQNPQMAKIALKPGEFAIFYPPYGAHAPNKTEGAQRPHRKVVVKVKV